MVGKTSAKRRALPTTAVDIAKAKYEFGMRTAVVPTGAGTEVVVKQGAKGTAFAGQPQIVHRIMGRGGPLLTSSRAKALRGCKGKKGCDFATCVKGALGVVPTNLAKACGHTGMDIPRTMRVPAQELV
jgi:hypothetical protein